MSPGHRAHQEEPAAYEPPKVEDVASEDTPIVTAAGDSPVDTIQDGG